MRELKEINKLIKAKLEVNDVSIKTFTSHMQKNKKVIALVLKIAKEPIKIDREPNKKARVIYQSIQEHLQIKKQNKKAIFHCKLILTSFKEIESHLKKAKIYDTIGKSYYETQVLKEIIKDEIQSLENVYPEIISHIDNLDIQIQKIAAQSYDFERELKTNQNLNSFQSIKNDLKKISDENKLSDSILKTRMLHDDVSRYLGFILIENQINSKIIGIKIEDIISIYVKDQAY